MVFALDLLGCSGHAKFFLNDWCERARKLLYKRKMTSIRQLSRNYFIKPEARFPQCVSEADGIQTTLYNYFTPKWNERN